MSLVEFIRWAGVIVALVASLLSAPEATHSMQVAITSIPRRAVLRYRTRGTTRVRVYRAGLSGQVVSKGPSEDFNATPAVQSIEERIGQLELLVLTLRHELDERNQSLTSEVRAGQDAVELLRQQGADLRDELAAVKRKSLRSDTQALPVVGLGVVLSGVSEELADHRLIALLLLTVTAVLLTRAVVYYVHSDWS